MPGFSLKVLSMSRRASDGKTLQPLPDVLHKALWETGLGNLATLVRLKKGWPVIAGPQLARVSRPVRFRWGELLVSVKDAMWLQQMSFFQADLRDNIGTVVGDAKVTRLRFVLAYASDAPTEASSPPGERNQPRRLTADEESMVQSGTAGISNPGLREAAGRAWRKDLLSKR